MRSISRLAGAGVLVIAVGPGGRPGVVGAAEPAPPTARNVRLVNHLPGTAGAVSLEVVRYRHREVMFVSSTTGLRSYDVADPDRPVLLDHLARAELALPGDDPGQNFWENEDLEIDPRRKLVFLAR